MDLLEIRKKAKQQKGAAPTVVKPQEPQPEQALEHAPVVSVSSAPDPEIRELGLVEEAAAVEPAPPVPVRETVVPATDSDDSLAADFEAFMAGSVVQAPGGSAAQPPADAGESDAAFGEAFFDLASEELYRHTYDVDDGEDEEAVQVLLCRIADEEYGIDIHKIREIIKTREITEIPRAPRFILGIITLRGTVIPVLDLRERLNLQVSDMNRQTKIVVVAHEEQLFGLIVDTVIDVARIPERTIEGTPSVMVGVEGKFIQGIGRSNEQMVILLNLNEVLDVDVRAA